MLSRLRDELFDAKIENTKLDIQLDAIKRERDAIETERASLSVRYQKTVEELAEVKTKNAVLMERLDLLANHLPPAPTQATNHISEEQEDADYAFHAGLIDRDEFDAILATAGALNTEISIDDTRL